MSGNQSLALTKSGTTNFSYHEYYGPLIDSYVKSILKSGLLLDEDLEILLSISKFRNVPERNGYKPSLSLLASIISVLSSSFLAKKLQMPLLVIPPIIATVSFALLEYRNDKKKRENKELIDKLLETLNKIQKLSLNLVRYMKTKCDLGKTKEKDSLVLYNKNMEDFMNIFSKNNGNLFIFLIDKLKNFSNYSTELQEDFIIIEHLDSKIILFDPNLGDIENCLDYTKRIHDINILIFSKLLCYIGVLFNSEILNESNLEGIINGTLPKIVQTLQEHHDTIKIQFVALRHSTNKKCEIKLQSQANKRKNISTKLEATLVSSVNNLSVILEKSQNILDRLECGSDNNLAQIGNDIVDLRNHTFATYESLDLLCKLYGILSNTSISHPVDHRININSKPNDTSSEIVPTVNYDDKNEPAEEKFELYIGVDESNEECFPIYYEDKSSTYLSLMLQELKQSLKQHERFIQARNKRGSDDEDEEKIKIEKEKQVIPKFSIENIKVETGQKQVTAGSPSIPVDKKIEVTHVAVPLIPAPPPPPLPSFSLDNLEDEPGPINARSMLENIKALSSQRNAKEDVFGESDEDSDCSS